VCWIQDEPDGNLSIRSCLQLAKLFKQALENGCQVIASIHSPVVMEQFEKVYSLEHRRWMKPQEFIKCHMESSQEKSDEERWKKYEKAVGPVEERRMRF